MLVVSALLLSCNLHLFVGAFGIVNTIGARGSVVVSKGRSNGFLGSFQTQTSSTSTSTTTRLSAVLPQGYQDFGNNAIREAARQCGMVFDNENEVDGDGDNNNNMESQNGATRLGIEWKAGSIIVTVHGEVALAAGGASGSEDEKEENVGDVVENEGEEDEPFGDLEVEGEGDDSKENDEPQDEEEEQEPEEFSLTLLARTINKILDDDGTGLAIAEVHSIEVTTPGVADELVPGTPQFEAFKGFEVIVQQFDTKTKKVKTIEGRLVERNDEFTIINMKGRMKKLKNETVQSVRLPKAKKEKGAR